MPHIADLVSYLDQLAPRSLAAEWDNTGLLLGDLTSPANRIMTCLTVTTEVVAEAVQDQVELIVAHHPILFRGTKRLSCQSPDGRLLGPLMRPGIAVYSPHTAYDNCPGGINDGLARRLGLTDVRPLIPKEGRRECKLVVFVPESDLAKVSDALFAAGAGVIGNYEQCSFRIPGTGTFYGTESTNPVVGQKGRREAVAEWRLEVVLPESRLAEGIAALRSAHSYEEPAFDVYPLKPMSRGGEGRVGQLIKPMPLEDLARGTRNMLSAGQIQVVGDPHRLVSRIALACGSAGRFYENALQAKADVFLTGEMSFHDCLAAQTAGLAVLLPGHYATERPGVEDLARLLAAEFRSCEVWASRREQDPLTVA